MVAPLGTPSSRFQLESHRHDGSFVCALPYRNVQTEAFMGSQGAQLRCDVPYKAYSQVTQANLYPGRNELWLFDMAYSGVSPIFAGPLWDATASSSTGVVSCSAQDPLSYLVKRLLKADKTYTAQQPADMMSDLLTYTRGVSLTNITNLTASKATSNASTVSQKYNAIDRNLISDLLNSISAMGDGVDYYVRNSSGAHILQLWGGKKNPTQLTYALEYGGNLANYSLQVNAQAITNDYDVIGSNSLVGNAANTTAQTSLNALYQTVDRGSDLTTQASLNTAAATGILGKAFPLQIESLTTKALMPVKDFDFGDQFTVVVDDYWAQYNSLIRVVGWQITLAQGDSFTTVIYANDTSEV